MRYPVIIALDPPRDEDPVLWSIRIIDSLRNTPAGYKIGLPLLIRTGPKGAGDIASVMPTDAIKVADLKLADIGPVMVLTASVAVEAGYTHVIAHPFTGVEGGLDELVKYLRVVGAELILLASMSNPGAARYFDQFIDEFVLMGSRLGAWGYVAPATRPHMIRRVREVLAKTPNPAAKIVSPGIGAQGQRPWAAIKAGADYEIVGRAVTRAEDPAEALEKLYGSPDGPLPQALRGGGRPSCCTRGGPQQLP